MALDLSLVPEQPDAGLELNLRLVTEILGVVAFHDGAAGPVILTHGERLPMPDYSRDREAAFLVVDHFIDRGYAASLYATKHAHPYMTWACHFAYDGTTYRAHAPTLPLAVCRCALLAREGTPP
jgi:Phage ABA sandwich domain